MVKSFPNKDMAQTEAPPCAVREMLDGVSKRQALVAWADNDWEICMSSAGNMRHKKGNVGHDGGAFERQETR